MGPVLLITGYTLRSLTVCAPVEEHLPWRLWKETGEWLCFGQTPGVILYANLLIWWI